MVGKDWRPWLLGREGIAMARSQPVVTGVTALIVGVVCTVILATVGQSAAAEARVLGAIDRAGTRTIVVTDSTGRAVLYADSVQDVQSLGGVGWVLGLGPVADVFNVDLGAAGRPVASRRLYGTLPPDLVRVFGRLPLSGEALVGVDALPRLGAAQPVTGVVGGSLTSSVVGAFDAKEPLAFLNRSVLIVAPPEALGSRPVLRQLVVMVDRVEDVPTISRAVRELARAEVSSELRIDTPAALVELRTLVQTELSSNTRQLLLIVLGVGLSVIAITLAGSVSQHRRDYGRRRALGASRSDVVFLVLSQAFVAALPGVAFGTILGLTAVLTIAGSVPPSTFTVGVAMLAVLVALGAAVPPALLAAYGDPLLVLRVP
jgi:putative ABC transport system permease protein